MQWYIAYFRTKLTWKLDQSPSNPEGAQLRKKWRVVEVRVIKLISENFFGL